MKALETITTVLSRLARCLPALALLSLACSSSTSTPASDASLDANVPPPPAEDAGECPASCDDGNACTVDSCDPTSHLCVHSAVADGTPCEDGSACTINDICQGGLCYSGPFKPCQALDTCHVAGSCNPRTGECTNPNAPERTPCDDGRKCTIGDQCTLGVCTGTPLVCPGGNRCDESTGACTNAGATDGGAYGFPSALSGLVYQGLTWPSNGNAIARDNSGRVFVAGSFAGTVDLGVGAMDTGDTSDTDVFLAELDATKAQAQWTRQIVGNQRQGVYSFSVNGAGQLGIVGTMGGSMTVGAQEIVAKTTTDFFLLAAGTADGIPTWLRRFTLRTKATSTRGYLSSVAGDPNGNAFVVCGAADKAATDISPDLVWQGGIDVVLASFDGTAGTPTWAQQIGGVNDEQCNFVAVDAQSNIYVVGSYLYGSSVSIGGLAPLPMVDTTSATWLFVAKLDATGKGLWATSIGTGGKTYKATAAAAVADGIVLAGIAPGGGSVAGVALDTTRPLFVAKLAGDSGAVAWLNPVVSSSRGGASDRICAVTATSTGDLIVAGNYADTLSLANVPLPTIGSGSGAFVAKLGHVDGSVAAVRGYGGPSEVDSVWGLSTDVVGTSGQKDDSFLLGQFVTSVDLGAPLEPLTAQASTQSNPATFVVTLAP